jgi:hypothetical protein
MTREKKKELLHTPPVASFVMGGGVYNQQLKAQSSKVVYHRRLHPRLHYGIAAAVAEYISGEPCIYDRASAAIVDARS